MSDVLNVIKHFIFIFTQIKMKKETFSGYGYELNKRLFQPFLFYLVFIIFYNKRIKT